MRSRSPQFRAVPHPVDADADASCARGTAGRPRDLRCWRRGSARAALCVVSSLFASFALFALFMLGCKGGKGSSNPNAQSIERQSDAEYDLARDLLIKDNPRAALDHAMKAISFNEDNDKAQYFVAVIYLKFCSTNRGLQTPDCKLGEIEKYARAAIKANEDFHDAKNLLGQVLVLEKRCKEAITVLQPLTLNPAYIHPYYAWGNLGEAQTCDGQLDAAIASLKNAVAGEPRFCVGHYRLGLALEKKNDLASAEVSFASSVSADPGCEDLQDGWWSLCRVKKRVNNAAWKQDCDKCRTISTATATGNLCAQSLGVVASAPAALGSAALGSAAPAPVSLMNP